MQQSQVDKQGYLGMLVLGSQSQQDRQGQMAVAHQDKEVANLAG